LDLSENVSYVPSKSVVGRSQIPVRNQNTGRHKSDQNSHGLSPNRGSGRKTTACTPHLHPGTGRDNTTTSLLQMPTKPKETRNFIYKQNLPQNYWGGGKRKAPLLHNHEQRSLPRGKIARNRD